MLFFTFILLLLKFYHFLAFYTYVKFVRYNSSPFHCHVFAVTVLGRSSYTLYAFFKNGDNVSWYSCWRVFTASQYVCKNIYCLNNGDFSKFF